MHKMDTITNLISLPRLNNKALTKCSVFLILAVYCLMLIDGGELKIIYFILIYTLELITFLPFGSVITYKRKITDVQ